ncbi:hypothetical protein [Tepidiphilus margaritifer]|uniref:hypothetical protein n=1 Tax=Tepidiphilus margaritifer TaxID=203471 RepID=UPI00048C1DDE|nr:hypothetical protein [Tepidiphilus margaritifer]
MNDDDMDVINDSVLDGGSQHMVRPSTSSRAAAMDDIVRAALDRLDATDRAALDVIIRDDDPAIRQLIAAIIIASARPDAVRAADKVVETAEKIIEALDKQSSAVETLRKTMVEIQDVNRDFVESSLIESVKTLEAAANNNTAAIIKSASQNVVKGLGENVSNIVKSKMQNMVGWITITAIAALCAGAAIGIALTAHLR